MKIISGIYEIKNKLNNKSYYGSSINIYFRFLKHKWMLKNNKHHSQKLQRAWNKYGKENFEFNIIVAVDERFLFEEEQKYLDKNINGYNIGKYAEGGMKGRKHSKEVCEKISQAKIGNQYSKGKIPWNKGKKASPELIEKLKIAHSNITDEHRKLNSEGVKRRFAYKCRNGHVRTQENTKILSNGWRLCLICKKNTAEKYNNKIKESLYGN